MIMSVGEQPGLTSNPVKQVKLDVVAGAAAMARCGAKSFTPIIRMVFSFTTCSTAPPAKADGRLSRANDRRKVGARNFMLDDD